LFPFAFTLVNGATILAKERKDKKTGTLSKPTVVNHHTSFDANRIFNYIVNNGDVVTDNVTGSSGFFWPSVPRTSPSQTDADLRGDNTTSYSAGVWIGGTVNNEIRIAVVEYSSHFIAGKILPDGKPDDPNLEKYRVYKIMKGDGPLVDDWKEWPVADGAATNPDGTPRLIGDQTLWFVMNDLHPSRRPGPVPGSELPIGLEVQTTVFGFNSSGSLGDIMFVKWVIINKGTADLDSAFIGAWADDDNGDASDDLVGCDTTLGIGFTYGGDTFDGSYGTNTPAIGFDFFQGPLVDKDGKDNDRDGAIDEPGERLKMTSFAKYTNGAPAGQGDPDTPKEVYNYLTGYWQDGAPFIDPIIGQQTKFIHAGDPVTRRGDLDFSPGDRRYLISSGPFKLAKGDTQVIVGAKIVAPGTKPSSSISALRFWDSFAQNAFDNNFDIVVAPSPKVTSRRLDQEIILTWLEEHQAVESFLDRGYKFQGYVVYQGASQTGPFTPIAAFDLADGLQDVFDKRLDPASGQVLDLPVIQASDLGVQRHISITTDAIFNQNQRLSNYRDYYFAVTAYVVNLEATPRVIESPIIAIRVSPSTPDYGVSIGAKTGARAELIHTGTGDGVFFYQVVDPTLVQSASYKVTWNDDSTPEEGKYTWNLDKNGARVLSNQPITGRDSEENPNDNATIFDGLQLHILPGTFSAPKEIFSFKQTVKADSASNGLSLWPPLRRPGGPFGLPDDTNLSFWGGGTTDTKKLQPDLELRFTGVRASENYTDTDTTIVSGGQLAIFRSRGNAEVRDLVRVPFEVWDVENNIQLNVFVTERNIDGHAPWGDIGQPLYYRITSRDYITVIYTPYNEATLTKDSFDRTDSNATWILFFESGENDDPSEWNTGDRFVVRYANPTITLGDDADEYTFTTTKSVVIGQSTLAKTQLQKINIVPNPYWAHNPGERDPINRFVRVTNLPGSRATIRIFTLAGELVRVIDDQDRQNDPSGISTIGSQYATWDLRNDAGIPVASGIYIVHVEVPGVGTVVRKAFVVMPEERLNVF
jgi:hypothetical protein